MELVFGMILMVGMFYAYAKLSEHYERKINMYERLLEDASLNYDFHLFLESHKNLKSRNQALRKFFTPEKLQYAQEQCELLKRKKNEENLENQKKWAIDRYCARGWEDFIFTEFERFAQKSTFGDGKYVIPFNATISAIDLKEDFCNYYLATENYEDTLKFFLEHDILQYNYKDNELYSIGFTLTNNVHIISKDDIDFDKWYHQRHAGQWSVKSSRNFTPDEIDAVVSNVIVTSEWGNSVCFTMKAGGKTYIPLTLESTKGTGESIDMHSAKILTLEKQGETDIVRVEC
ncbi:MAG: hypothetical protein MJZ79_05310 [Paludibacteraceae bacterium]|nr:hypothetical protein [Paludibacteraceae bacterium]